MWFRANGPAYPWRRLEHDPYAVLVSEIMLQQTQAGRANEAFPTFLERFPDVGALAAASRADVLRAWGGLGYSRRAVAMHETARSIVRDHDGVVPNDATILRAFPGVGPYTAAAVTSIAFGTPVAAIDTNVRKVMARLAFGRDPADVTEVDIARAADRWLTRHTPGDWNPSRDEPRT